MVSELRREGVLSGEEATMVALLVSELVANAVIHSDAPPHLGLDLVIDAGPERVRVEVGDAGRGLAARSDEASASPAGIGLELVHRTASRWGLHESGGLRVWFEIDRQPGHAF